MPKIILFNAVHHDGLGDFSHFIDIYLFKHHNFYDKFEDIILEKPVQTSESDRSSAFGLFDKNKNSLTSEIKKEAEAPKQMIKK